MREAHRFLVLVCFLGAVALAGCGVRSVHDDRGPAVLLTQENGETDLRGDRNVEDAVGVHVADRELAADAHAAVGRAPALVRIAVDLDRLERDRRTVRASGVATFWKT